MSFKEWAEFKRCKYRRAFWNRGAQVRAEVSEQVKDVFEQIIRFLMRISEKNQQQGSYNRKS